jgi:hypothetical protein
MIVKETTNLGVHFLDACFRSQFESGFTNEIVLVDNGSSKLVRENLYDEWRDRFKVRDIALKIYDHPEIDDFGALRNICIEKTYEHTDLCRWLDSDEVDMPEDWDRLKGYILPDHPKANQFYTYFYHFIISPFNIQCTPGHNQNLSYGHATIMKDNIFRFHKGLKWVKEKKVHEKMSNLLEGYAHDTGDVRYLHFGYVRKQWEQAVKWLHYAMLEFGHLGCYKNENIDVDEDGNDINISKKPKVTQIQKDYFRDWRTPDHCLDDRKSICAPFPNYLVNQDLPQGYLNLIGDCKTEEDWINYINQLDPNNEIWDKWQELKEKYGNWSMTLDEIYDFSRNKNKS